MKKRFVLLAGVVTISTLWGAPGTADVTAGRGLSAATAQPGLKLARAAEVCAGLPATIVGTDGPDKLTGTSGPDVVSAGNGDDFVDALEGNDVICGGSGADTIVAGAGDDKVYGGADAFWFDGRGDHKVGDLIDPGAGNDLIDPVADARNSRDETIPDRVTYATSPVPVTVNLGATGSTGTVAGDGADTIVTAGQVGIIGSGFADSMNGSGRDDYLEGGGGSDTINGLGGGDVLWAEGPVPGGDDNDTLAGGEGVDYLYSFRGRDSLSGGPEIDSIYAQSGDPAKVSAGAGNDALFANVVRGGGSKIDGSSGIDVLTLATTFGDPGSRPNVRVNLASGVIDSAVGGAGTVKGIEQVVVNDYVSVDFTGANTGELVGVARGGALDARLNGGNDFAYGSFFNDRLDGGNGHDTVWGQAGTDSCTSAESRRLCE
ncbi:calcium-binding protein [Nocardioides sp. LHG3406-4]|uniref:calcium-binding protein n=1 Tax=Nocardioides sp. LHG3406-4 TaxID=2804575 RepID=UPI003CF54B0B